MQLDVVIEQRFYRCSENKYWTNNAFPYDFWLRYLQVFNYVNIVARVALVDSPEPDWKRVDGQSVGFICLPTYIGPVQFALTLLATIAVLRKRKSAPRKVIYRIPGILSAMYHFVALPQKQAFAAEVVGDPADVFAQGASKSPFRLFFRWLFVRLLKYQCQRASAISYVTEFSLQARYPPAQNTFKTHYSSIQLTSRDYVKRYNYPSRPVLKIVCIGNLTQPYKGCDFMLQTIAYLKQQQIKVVLRWIGGGYLQSKMEALASQLGIQEQVVFVGNLADRELIRNELDAADIFVLSSRQEGLPRVLIEAMARSLVCIATRVGGVPELLPDKFIVERDNQQQLASIVQTVALFSEKDRLTYGQQNYDKAQDYNDMNLMVRRKAMYQHLLETN